MPNITLAGTLRDPNGSLAVGDQVRFTHKSTTGETVQSAVSVLTIDPTGVYSVDLEYGLVLVEYKDVRKSQFKNLGVATVNGDNPATSIPELLNALVPVSSAELIEFQAILADCVAAQVAAEAAQAAAEAAAATLDLIADLSQAYIFETVAAFKDSLIDFPDGKNIHLNDRDADFTKITGIGTGNDANIIASTSVNQSATMSDTSTITGKSLGMLEGAADNAAKLQLLDTFDWNEIIVDGDYSYNSNVILALSDRAVKISGNGSLTGVGGSFKIAGSLTTLGAISISTAAEGDRTITVTGLSGLASGDLIIIHNQVDFSFSPHRADYQDGEFVEVESVAGDVITLAKPLESTYTAVSTNKVFKSNSVTPTIEDVTFNGDTSYPLQVIFARGGAVKPKKVSGGTFGAFSLDKSYGTDIHIGEYYNASANTGLQYGISIINCQDITGYSPIAHGTRHGIATGGDSQDGAVPCRRIKFYNAVITNDTPSVHATDFHGNTKDSGFYNCTSFGDVALSGVNVEYVGGTIVGGDTAAPLSGGEFNGGYIKFDGVTLVCTALSTATSMFKFLNSADTIKISNDYNIVLNDISIENNALLEVLMDLFVNAPTVKSNWSLTNIRPENPLVGNQRVVKGTVSGSGVRPESVVVRDIQLDPASIQFWMSTSGSFVGSRLTLPATHYEATFIVDVASKVSPSAEFNHPVYPVQPLLTLSTDGGVLDATGGYLVPFQTTSQLSSKATLAVETSTNVNSTASMNTNILASVSMENYVR